MFAVAKLIIASGWTDHTIEMQCGNKLLCDPDRMLNGSAINRTNELLEDFYRKDSCLYKIHAILMKRVDPMYIWEQGSIGEAMDAIATYVRKEWSSKCVLFYVVMQVGPKVFADFM